ncbi:MAG TPA: Hsp20/alpha crystallin family protein [Leptospiraceae bacterium]|jgi:HSP20 family protein|nr:Hsp20/alpha crystallin family protein [Leptospirales bacterium]HMU85769.1 Hsp20/alpha crystallin family protein [Leptospiraceae bacterium]HMW59776.1 Hsp20/alpha crystallin family protein [Leptospiraceae bacterium]HMX54897.1 Hsp20/alpha crystallin family protein [Leptospiraceae bacterium]HMY44637.1 Hsp20/alpha crystallin family protein [Leptospiraceae bacterium]
MNTLMRLPSLFGWADELEPVFRTELQGHTPPVEIKKGDKEYRVTAHLPGVKRENLNVTVENGFLTISGKYETREEKEYQTVRSEIVSYSTFKRSLKIDQNSFDVENVDAKLTDGVLEIRLPIKASVQPRQIDVKVN